VVVCLIATACGGRGGQRDLPNPFTSDDDEVLLTIHNHDFKNANVYAHWTGGRDRVGTVPGMTSETFTFRWRDEEVSLGIEFIGNTDGYRTQRIDVTQGDHLDYIIWPRPGR